MPPIRTNPGSSPVVALSQLIGNVQQLGDSLVDIRTLIASDTATAAQDAPVLAGLATSLVAQMAAAQALVATFQQDIVALSNPQAPTA
jgi:hypothetical protein